MKKQYWILLFAAILIGDLIGIQLQNEQVQFIFKPLIIPVIIGYLDSQSGSITKGLNKWILIALLFSLLGDVLLMFQAKKEIFFLLGLFSFLVTHVIYGLCFSGIIRSNNIKRNIFFFLFSLGYVIFLLRILTPYLGEMKWPVVIYGSILGGMFTVSLHLSGLTNRKAGYFIILGALLFVISDSLLAINKFYQPFEEAGVLIMLTYGIAQFFIVEGATRYLNSADKK